MPPKVTGVAGVILAGGRSSRLGRPKALLDVGGTSLIERIACTLDRIFCQLFVVTNFPELLPPVPASIVGDVVACRGPISGIHSGLVHSRQPYVFVVACDMPFVAPDLIRAMCEARDGFDAVVPDMGGGLEPLFAVYGDRCTGLFGTCLERGDGRIVSIYDKIRIRWFVKQEVEAFGPPGRLFYNINTEDDYRRALALLAGAQDPGLSPNGLPADS
ncbi:MAG: molybdenum cofactor guanylyltransferase [Firmicutes bacterium]|nr:molybdenum cofactor guanylyltransferase [Bacillota bacterium]